MKKMCGNCIYGKIDKGKMAFVTNIGIAHAIKCNLDEKSRSRVYVCDKYKGVVDGVQNKEGKNT